jgi:FSR family fosmidomycin resistance protein-like MFS transporter
MADHYQTRFFILGGPLMVIIFTSLVGIAPDFWTLLLFVCIGSVGSSMFHPTVAGMISTYSGKNLGFSMSVFNMGGAMAFGLGPMFISAYVSRYELAAMPWVMLPGLIPMAVLYYLAPYPRSEGLKNFGLVGSIREVFGTVWKPIVMIWVIMALRAFVTQSLLTYLPVHYARLGYSLVSIGGVISAFTIAGAISGLIAGHLSDRIGYKPIFYVTHIVTPFCVLLMLYLPGPWIYISSFLTGFFALAILPLGDALAQQLAPKGKSMASSLMMGFALGTGGVLTPITGKLADIFGIVPVLNWIALAPVIALVLVYYLPNDSL